MEGVMSNLFVLPLPDNADLLVCEGGVWRVVHGFGGETYADDMYARVLAREGLLASHDRATRLLEEARASGDERLRLVGVSLARQYYERRAFVESHLGAVCPPTLAPLDLSGRR